MTALLAGLAGLLSGCLVNRASDDLPRRLGKPGRAGTDLRAPACGLGAAAASLLRRRRVERRVWLAAAVELASALLFAAVAAKPAVGPGEVGAAALVAFLLLIALIDLKHRLVLNALVYPAVAAAALVNVVLGEQSLLGVVGGGVFAFLMFAIVASLRPGDLGGGDVKLAALLGTLFGFPLVLWVLLVGTVAGGGAALVFTGGEGRSRHMPLAPFLCLGAVVGLLFNPLPLLIR